MVCGENGEPGIELGKHLPAGTAGADDFIGIGSDRDAKKVSFPCGDSRANGHPFGAHREPEAEIFDVAAAENRAVRAEECRSHREPGIRRMGVFSDLDGGANQ